MWLRHRKPKECSHFLRLANKKKKNVNEGTKVSEVSFFSAALKWSTSIPFSYYQNITSLLQLHIFMRGKKTFCFLGYLKALPQCCTWDVPALLWVPVKLTDSSHQAPFPTAAGGKPCSPVQNKGTSSPSTALEKNTPAGTCATGVTQLCLYMVGFSLRDLTGTTLAPFFSPQQYKWV